jgi:hypothetical protein
MPRDKEELLMRFKRERICRRRIWIVSQRRRR